MIITGSSLQELYAPLGKKGYRNRKHLGKKKTTNENIARVCKTFTDSYSQIQQGKKIQKQDHNIM
jgi:hypothetical protein